MLIREGTIIDGTGLKRRKADIRLRGKKIQEIGTLTPKRGEEVIRARGKFVAPGFIGVFEHKYIGSHLFSHATQERFIRQGVTTMLVGAGGTSLAPLTEPEIPSHIQTNINWRSIKEYLATLSRQQPKCNIGTFIGYDTVANVGNEEQIYHMIAQGISEGAFGVSFASQPENPEFIRTIAKKHYVVIPKGPNPNISFPQFLQHNVREKKILSWEEAIHRITGKVATETKITMRGKLIKGYYGDIVIFDPMHISDTQGVSRVLVNGGTKGEVLKYS